MDSTINAKQVRKELSETLNKVKYTHDRISITKYGKPVAALIPIEDLEFLEEIEEELDRRAIDEALAEQGDDPYIPWEQVKRELDAQKDA
jgi:prevent-host-death family protein